MTIPFEPVRVPLTLEDLKREASTDVPTAGRMFYGLGSSSSYAAARRGEIPTLRIGKKLIVPIAAVLKQLGITR
ncbi:hypothetical protein E3O45_15150 [Cryobacterium sp. TMS1-20-1]|uniref:hypothetical protein n=1 Tax=Cryobacterium sp. TMS1-20-1 TaxID=1259223 RepID=UPI00106A46FA|nr:hypothetical protein [Cryobacterium sp. TMS1-20-1]TFC71408.1 hypothetical protein E3O45_15150 [Cryobacterium sp. TMS1-20-1]